MKKYTSRFVFIILLFIISVSFFQPEGKKLTKEEYFKEGEYFFRAEDYKEAVYYYLQLLRFEPNNAHFNYKVGLCYINMTGYEPLAIPYFEKGLNKLVEKKDYKERSFSEQNAPLHLLFYLGNAYRANNQIEQALKTYNEFINSPLYFDNYNVTVVENEIKSCERAKIIQDNPINLIEQNLPDNINSQSFELHPVVSGDENTIVFVRRLKFYDAIFYSQKVNGEWTEPKNISPELRSDGEFYPSCLNSTGNELYLIGNKNDNDDIYYSVLKDGIWSEAEKIGKKVNSPADESYASISKDGTTLYFSSNRKENSRGKDIYYSIRTNGTWNRAKRLSKNINTKNDEEAPCIANNGKTLFFSSKGHYGMGGYDIFYSNKIDKDWSVPTNIGFPLNTTRDDLFYYPILDGKEGYLSKSDSIVGTNYDIVKLHILSSLNIVGKGN